MGAWNTGNGYSEFVTAPQIYTPTAPLGSRWTGLLADSGIDRGYHNGALLMPSGEVRPAPARVSGHIICHYGNDSMTKCMTRGYHNSALLMPSGEVSGTRPLGFH